jgi:hypothetical protein
MLDVAVTLDEMLASLKPCADVVSAAEVDASTGRTRSQSPVTVAAADPVASITTTISALHVADADAVAVADISRTRVAEDDVVETAVTADPESLYLTAAAAVVVTVVTDAAPSLNTPSKP